MCRDPGINYNSTLAARKRLSLQSDHELRVQRPDANRKYRRAPMRSRPVTPQGSKRWAGGGGGGGGVGEDPCCMSHY